MEVTAEEARAIKSLERVAQNWPKSLWLFSASGTLHVMKYADNGDRMRVFDGMDPDASVTTINISNDGGDW